jgi:hypothetical protein
LLRRQNCDGYHEDSTSMNDAAKTPGAGENAAVGSNHSGGDLGAADINGADHAVTLTLTVWQSVVARDGGAG